MCVRERVRLPLLYVCVSQKSTKKLQVTKDQVTVFWREACDDNVLCEEYGGVDGWVTTN